jgi:hypothetical protein
MNESVGADSSTAKIVVERRTWLQDAVRSYRVFVDGETVGRIWALQTKSFSITPGKHTFQLRIVATGRSCSEEIEVDLAAGQTVYVRTVGRGFSENALLPFAMPAGAKALATGQEIQSRYYRGPWIHLQVSEPV